MRTAHHTGLPYGQVDIDYLLSMVRLDDEGHICLDPKAMRTAEHLLLARYFDYQQVSFHKTVAAYETLLEDVLGILVQSGKLDCSKAKVEKWIAEPGRWIEFDDAYVTHLLRECGRETKGVDQQKVLALLKRTGPKLIWSREFFSEQNSNKKDLALERQILRSAKDQIADELNIPSACLWIWSRRTNLTSMGSQVPASRARDMAEDEKRALGESVLIGRAGQKAERIAECESSLFHALADQSLANLRMYALFPPERVFDRDAAHLAVQRHFP
jgi:HD superfamily phosphohydrolase